MRDVFSGEFEGTRTLDPVHRKHMLYPSELQTQDKVHRFAFLAYRSAKHSLREAISDKQEAHAAQLIGTLTCFEPIDRFNIICGRQTNSLFPIFRRFIK
jgi:hypothetical protein